MLIARIIGVLVATQKHPSHEGRKALLAQPLGLEGELRGDPLVALDWVDAGEGDLVLVTTEGWSAMTSVERPQSPIDMAVIAVIDSVELTEPAAEEPGRGERAQQELHQVEPRIGVVQPPESGGFRRRRIARGKVEQPPQPHRLGRHTPLQSGRDPEHQ